MTVKIYVDHEDNIEVHFKETEESSFYKILSHQITEEGRGQVGLATNGNGQYYFRHIQVEEFQKPAEE